MSKVRRVGLSVLASIYWGYSPHKPYKGAPLLRAGFLIASPSVTFADSAAWCHCNLRAEETGSLFLRSLLRASQQGRGGEIG